MLPYIRSIPLSLLLVCGCVLAQSDGKLKWPKEEAPGGDKAVAVVPAGADPDGCQVTVSRRYGCEAILCRGTQSITFNDKRGVLTAQKIALAQAKSHMSAFFDESIKRKETINLLDVALKKEGGKSPTSERTTGESVVTTIESATENLLRGVAVVEQGSDVEGGEVWAVVATSCGTRNAAGEAKRDMTTPAGSPSPNSGDAAPKFYSPPVSSDVRKAKEGF
jgi:hypothetical protein